MNIRSKNINNYLLGIFLDSVKNLLMQKCEFQAKIMTNHFGKIPACQNAPSQTEWRFCSQFTVYFSPLISTLMFQCSKLSLYKSKGASTQQKNKLVTCRVVALTPHDTPHHLTLHSHSHSPPTTRIGCKSKSVFAK